MNVESTKHSPGTAQVAAGVFVLALLLGAPTVLLYARATPSTGPVITHYPELQRRGYRSCSATGKPIQLDVDRDGREDRFLVREAPPVGPLFDFECAAVFRVELHDGDVIEQPSQDITWIPRLDGPTDLDRNGVPEVWMLGGESVDPITFDRDGHVVEFGLDLTAGAAHADPSVECTDLDGDDIPEVVQTLEAIDPADESWSYRAYRFEGGRLNPFREGAGADRSGRPRSLRWDFSGCIPRTT